MLVRIAVFIFVHIFIHSYVSFQLFLDFLAFLEIREPLDNTGPVVGAIVGVLVASILVIALVFIIRMKRYLHIVSLNLSLSLSMLISYLFPSLSLYNPLSLSFCYFFSTSFLNCYYLFISIPSLSLLSLILSLFLSSALTCSNTYKRYNKNITQRRSALKTKQNCDA